MGYLTTIHPALPPADKHRYGNDQHQGNEQEGGHEGRRDPLTSARVGLDFLWPPLLLLPWWLLLLSLVYRRRSGLDLRDSLGLVRGWSQVGLDDGLYF